MKRILYALLVGTFLASPVWAIEKKEEPKQEDVYLLMDLLGATFQTIRDEAVEEISYRQMVEKSINGVLTSIDPHSGFLDAEEMVDMDLDYIQNKRGFWYDIGLLFRTIPVFFGKRGAQ